jgi:hypothetical protein
MANILNCLIISRRLIIFKTVIIENWFGGAVTQFFYVQVLLDASQWNAYLYIYPLSFMCQMINTYLYNLFTNANNPTEESYFDMHTIPVTVNSCLIPIFRFCCFHLSNPIFKYELYLYAHTLSAPHQFASHYILLFTNVQNNYNSMLPANPSIPLAHVTTITVRLMLCIIDKSVHHTLPAHRGIKRVY